MNRRINQIAFGHVLPVFFAVCVLTGCVTAPPPVRLVSIQTPVKKAQLKCALIVDRSFCAPNVATVEWKGFDPGIYPKADLSGSIITNSQILLGGLFSKVATLTSQTDIPDADVLVAPRVHHVSGKANGPSAFHDVTFMVDIAYTFMSKDKVPVFEIIASGQVTSSMGTALSYQSKGLQRAYDSISSAIESMAVALPNSARYNFYINNLDLFGRLGPLVPEQLDRIRAAVASDKTLASMLLCYSVRAGHEQLLASLLEHRASPNEAASEDGLRPLHWAAIYNNSKAITKLVESGANVNTRDKRGRIPLYYAAWGNNKAAVEAFLSANSEFDVYDPNSPILSAARTEEFGDYLASDWKKERAKSCYELSGNYLSKAEENYAKAQSKAARLEAWHTFSVIFLSALQSSLQASANNIQARQTAQISALKQANASGTGMPGYYNAMQSYNPNLPTPLAGSTLPLASEPGSNATSGALAASRKSATVGLARIKLKLGALEGANSYQEFKSKSR